MKQIVWILLLIVCIQKSFAATKNEVVFSEDVWPILQQHCVMCHRAGGIASMAQFISYETVRPWAKAIKEAVTLRQMPPWSADAEHSLPMQNDARLSNAEIGTLRNWVDAGAPEGGAGTKVAAPIFSNNWANVEGRKPDLVISMNRDVAVPANGDMPYLRLLVKLPLTENKWVAACETRPGNATVVHHMAITEVELPEGVSAADVDGLELLSRRMGFPTGAATVRPAVTSVSDPSAIDMLAIYTPGSKIETYAPGSGKLLKAGKNSYIDFNIHYAGSGQPATDRSQVAFWFRDTVPLHQIYRVPMSGETILANGKELMTDAKGIKAEGTRMVLPPIPAGAAKYELVTVTAFAQPVTIYQMHPHAHFRATEFTYTVVYPDGREQTLLTVPKYDFRWQLAYTLATPLQVPAGSKLVVSGHYDNSAANAANPAPDKEVQFLDQNKSTDEMFSPFVQYSVDTEIQGRQVQSANALPVIETVGCLGSSKRNWFLSKASTPMAVASQATSSMALEKAAQMALGSATFELIGLSAFNPTKHQDKAVVVRGVLISGSKMRLNVTSLQTAGRTCGLPQ